MLRCLPAKLASPPSGSRCSLGRVDRAAVWVPSLLLELLDQPKPALLHRAGVRSLRGSAADPRRGDRTPCGAAAPRGAGAGARAAAGAARPRRLTRARSRPPRAPPSPSVRGPAGRVPGLISPTSRRLAGPLRRALHSAHRNDATPHRDDATLGRTPGRVAGQKGRFHCLRISASSTRCPLRRPVARSASRRRGPAVQRVERPDVK